jgi:hypothetical protein
MAWGIYVEWRCIGYDAGKPFWPCETPDFILELINGPAIIVAKPLANLWQTAPLYFAYVVELPLILGWWWLVGTRLDFGLLGVGMYTRRKTWLGVFAALLILLVTLFGWSLWDDIRFYRMYPYLGTNAYFTSMRSLRSLPFLLWSLVLIFAFGLAASRVARGQKGQIDKRLASSRTLRVCGIGLCLYCVCAAGAVWHTKLVEKQREAEYDLHRIIIKGRVLDDRGLPVYAIEVSLVPILKIGETSPWGVDDDFTNENGEYAFSPDQPGQYLLSVQWNVPPSADHPFLTRYYPDAAYPKQAETLEITPAKHLYLNPIHLQKRLELVKVPVSVSWSNGTPEPEAYLLFINTQYPESGVIGSESLHPDSDGTVSIPNGFAYSATAQVECDAGENIKSAYTPELTISLKSPSVHTMPLHFILPGLPCRVWHPK